MSTVAPNLEWCVDCSDEESYFEPNVQYRAANDGTRIWEPNGQTIVLLYREIEAKGFNTLEWKCPGRISPSQLSQPATDEAFETNNDNCLGNSNLAKSEFDFDNDFEDTSFGSSNTRVTAKRNQGAKKSQTNLSKVMQHIKKYQVIDNTKNKSKKILPASSPIAFKSTSTNKTSNDNNIIFKKSESNIQNISDQ